MYRRLAEEERGLCLDWLAPGDVTRCRPVKTTCLSLKATKTQTTKNLLNVLSYFCVCGIEVRNPPKNTKKYINIFFGCHSTFKEVHRPEPDEMSAFLYLSYM